MHHVQELIVHHKRIPMSDMIRHVRSSAASSDQYRDSTLCVNPGGHEPLRLDVCAPWAFFLYFSPFLGDGIATEKVYALCEPHAACALIQESMVMTHTYHRL